jgi:Ca-activated chloride channel family protein
MSLLWPGFLVLLGLIPLLIAVYIWMLRRRRRFAVRYSSLSLVRQALPRQSRLRRYLSFGLFLLALASLVMALGRPVAIVSVPSGQASVILALDVSKSMCSTDIQPNRLKAAEAAALSFIERQKPTTQIGVVAFGTFAELIQPPTNDQEVLQTAIESLNVGSRTAIGSGILKSLDAIAEIDKNVAPSVTDASTGVEPTPVPKGAYAPDVIVLLTDGVSNSGPLPMQAARQAADRGVRVYTIGYGTDHNSSPASCDPVSQAGGQQSGNSGQITANVHRQIDEQTLKQVSDMTGGTYYPATSATELQKVFQDLPTYLIMEHETTEVSVVFTALGALLAGLAIALSLIWHPLP